MHRGRPAATAAADAAPAAELLAAPAAWAARGPVRNAAPHEASLRSAAARLSQCHCGLGSEADR